LAAFSTLLMSQYVVPCPRQGYLIWPLNVVVIIQGLLNLGMVDIGRAGSGCRVNSDGGVEGNGSNSIAKGLGILFSGHWLRGQKWCILPLGPKETCSLKKTHSLSLIKTFLLLLLSLKKDFFVSPGATNISKQPFKMRTKFFEMCFFNDASQLQDTSFYGIERSGREQESERERKSENG
jgi:hypothetical protein